MAGLIICSVAIFGTPIFLMAHTSARFVKFSTQWFNEFRNFPAPRIFVHAGVITVLPNLRQVAAAGGFGPAGVRAASTHPCPPGAFGVERRAGHLVFIGGHR